MVTTLKVNQAHAGRGAAAAPGTASALPSALGGAASVHPLLAEPSAPSAAELEADPGFDVRMGAKRTDRRRKATFEFVQEGTFQKQAELMR